MWFGIGKMCLVKKYDQNINLPNNYARTHMDTDTHTHTHTQLRNYE